MATITWALLADFDRSGTFETDLTAYVSRPGNGISIQRGIGPDGHYRVSSVSIALNNNDARFTPGNTAGPYYGQLNPDTPIRITATHATIDYTIWTGYVKSWKRQWRVGTVPMVTIQAWDLAAYLVDSEPINVTYSAARDTDGALIAVMDAMGLEAGDRDFDDGVQALPAHYALAQPAMTAMMDVVRSEMGGLLWVTAEGLLRFEARNSRLGVTVAQTWGDSTNIVPYQVEDLSNDDDYLTAARVRTTIFAAGQADVEVFRFSRGKDALPTADSMALTAGQTYEREYSNASGIVAYTTPVASTDYLANDAADGTGTDRTSSLDVTLTDLGGGRFRIRLVNTHSGTIYVTYFRLRGQTVQFFSDRPEAYVQKSVTGRKAGAEAQADVPFGGDDALQPLDFAMQICRTFRYPYPRIKLFLHADNDDAKVALLTAELGDRVRYTDTGLTTKGSYSDDWFYVEALGYGIPPDWAGQDFLAEVTLIPAYIYRDLGRIAYDDFTRDNATGDLGTALCGTAWSGDGNMDIVSGKARANSDSLQMPNIDLGGSDNGCQVVEVDLADIGGGSEVGVVFQYTDDDNQYRCYLDKGSNELILEKNVATTVTEILSPAFTVGTAHELKVLRQDDRIRAYVDGVLRIDTTDSAHSTGNKVGLFARNASGTTTFAHAYGQGV